MMKVKSTACILWTYRNYVRFIFYISGLGHKEKCEKRYNKKIWNDEGKKYKFTLNKYIEIM